MSKNTLECLKEGLPSNIYELVSFIIKQALTDNIEIFLVGGAVRDLLLKRNIFDMDLAMEMKTDVFAENISKKYGANFTYHPKFKTAKLKFPGFSVDIITTRKEIYKKPGALPNILQGNITDDLQRRDFTINAMAIRLPSGKIIDPLSGKRDIEAKYIRILHDRSFIDDATRIFRAVRYEQRLTFRIEPLTLKLLTQNLDMIETISADRVKHELAIAMNEEYPELFFSRLAELGVLKKVFHSLTWNKRLSLLFSKAREMLPDKSLQDLYFCLLIYCFDFSELTEFMNRYNFPKKVSAAMLDTINLKLRLDKLNTADMKLSDIYRLLRPYSPVSIQANLLSCESSVVIPQLSLYLSKLRNIKTQIKGTDLIDMGIPSGPIIGEILQALLNVKINGNVKTRADELNYLQKLINKKK